MLSEPLPDGLIGAQVPVLADLANFEPRFCGPALDLDRIIIRLQKDRGLVTPPF